MSRRVMPRRWMRRRIEPHCGCVMKLQVPALPLGVVQVEPWFRGVTSSRSEMSGFGSPSASAMLNAPDPDSEEEEEEEEPPEPAKVICRLSRAASPSAAEAKQSESRAAITRKLFGNRRSMMIASITALVLPQAMALLQNVITFGDAELSLTCVARVQSNLLQWFSSAAT